MAINNFIPEIWSARLLQNLHKALVFAQPGVMNTDYEGEIADMGDTVRINSIGAITVSDYTKNTDHATPEALQDSQTVLTIDRAKMFNFQIDDIDKVQTKPKVMDEAMREAAYALKNEADAFVAGLYTDIDTANFIGTEASPKTGYTAANVYEYLVDLKVLLDQANVPDDGQRFVVIPPFLEGWLLKDARFVGFGTVQNMENIANGEIGKAAGFKILESNNVKYTTTTTKYKVIAGHPMAWTMANQINKMEAYRPERRFADAIKGLHLYGAKVTRPSALACLVINTT